jgi:hypothetical protein
MCVCLSLSLPFSSIPYPSSSSNFSTFFSSISTSFSAFSTSFPRHCSVHSSQRSKRKFGRSDRYVLVLTLCTNCAVYVLCCVRAILCTSRTAHCTYSMYGRTQLRIHTVTHTYKYTNKKIRTRLYVGCFYFNLFISFYYFSLFLIPQGPPNFWSLSP